jgi:hypothetical protein
MGGSDDTGAPLATTDLFTPGSALFAASTPLLNQARAGAQAVALSSVGLLVVGGVDARGTTIPDAELYSATQNAFLPVSDPRLDGRVDHRVNVLSDGTVFVTGGSHDGKTPLATTLILDVRSDGTARVSAGPTLAEARRRHAAIVAIKVPIVFGGFDAANAPLDSIEAIDFDKASASVIGHLQYARADATASLLNDGSILIVGGVGRDGAPLTSAELYKPITRSTTVHEMATARDGHTATVLTDGRVLVAGGSVDHPTSVEMFASSGFVTERSLGTARAGHAAVSLCDETVLVVGGGAGAEIYSQPAN